MRKILIWGLAMLCLSMPAYASTTDHISDYANLLTNEQEDALNKTIMEMEYYSGYDFYLLTTYDNDGIGSREYAIRFLTERDVKSGTVYLIDMDDRECQIITTGNMVDIYTDEMVDDTLDHTWQYLADEGYYDYYVAVLEDTKNAVDNQAAGSEKENVKDDADASVTRDEISLDRNQVYYDGTVITYNEPIPDALYEYEVSKPFEDLPMDNPPLKILTNKEGLVRCITVSSDEVLTYNGIKVGMSQDRITATHDTYFEMGRSIDVYYQGDKFLGKEDFPTTDGYLLYSYRIDDGRIESFYICDDVYAKTMKLEASVDGKRPPSQEQQFVQNYILKNRTNVRIMEPSLLKERRATSTRSLVLTFP